MQDKMSSTAWRVAIYSTVSAVAIALLFATFGQFRFGDENAYNAVFKNVSGLQKDEFVRIGGVEVGRVKKVDVQPDTTVHVVFSVERAVVLTEGTRAVIRYDDLIGGRYLALEEGEGATKRLPAGGTIPISRTAPALDLDSVVTGFRPLLRALSPDEVNALTGQLIEALQGQGGTIGSLLNQAAAMTHTLADRDKLIGDVINNLNTVLGSLGSQGDQLGKTVDSLAELIDTLEARKQDITNGVAYANAAAKSIADMLSQSRQPLKKVVHEVDRTSGVVLEEKEYIDDYLATLPATYDVLTRQGLYGDFFTFYFCDVLLKLNGKGGQPVYVKLVEQSSGRCTPR
ncbi:MCE family protein [Mycolicibacterium sp. XJ1819]